MRVTQGPGISHLRIPVDLDAKDEFHLSAVTQTAHMPGLNENGGDFLDWHLFFVGLYLYILITFSHLK